MSWRISTASCLPAHGRRSRPSVPCPTGRREVETVVSAGRGLTERSIELTNELRTGGLRGARRAAVLTELQSALDAGQADAAAAPAEGGAA
jgi:hypothetical protein